MEDQKCKYPSGACQFHGVEVEQRKSGDKSIRNMLGLLIVVMGASFVYTTYTRNASDMSDAELRYSVAALSTVVLDLSNAVAEGKGYMKPLIQQLKYLNRNIVYRVPEDRPLTESKR